jgi:hypothetical protein
VVISLLITVCGLRNGDPCYFSDTIPDYLFFESPPYYLLTEYLTIEVGIHFVLEHLHIPCYIMFEISFSDLVDDPYIIGPSEA